MTALEPVEVPVPEFDGQKIHVSEVCAVDDLNLPVSQSVHAAVP